MASGAGLNRVGQRGGVLLLANIDSTVVAYTTPQTGYGVIMSNDSGAQMLEAIGFTKWTFQLIGGGNPQVTLFGTVDPAVYETGRGSTVCPATSWFQLPAPSEQSGTGGVSNPLGVNGVILLTCSLPLVAVRAVLTTAASSGVASVIGFAVP